MSGSRLEIVKVPFNTFPTICHHPNNSDKPFWLSNVCQISFLRIDSFFLPLARVSKPLYIRKTPIVIIVRTELINCQSLKISPIMDAVLRQSKAMCPFLKKTAPSTLRTLSTTTRTQAPQCGGTISKLQLLGQRCPVMGKALAIQSARVGRNTPMVGASGVRTLSGHSKAKIHTSRSKEARAVDAPLFVPRDSGMYARYCLIQYNTMPMSNMHTQFNSLQQPRPIARQTELFRPRRRVIPMPSSTMITFTRPNWKKSTRTSRTDTSTISTVLPKSFHRLMALRRKSALPSGVPMIISAWERILVF